MQYRDPDAIGKIKEITKDSLHHALDTISQASSQAFCSKVFGPGGGKVIVILDPEPEAVELRKDVNIQRESTIDICFDSLDT